MTKETLTAEDVISTGNNICMAAQRLENILRPHCTGILGFLHTGLAKLMYLVLTTKSGKYIEAYLDNNLRVGFKVPGYLDENETLTCMLASDPNHEGDLIITARCQLADKSIGYTVFVNTTNIEDPCTTCEQRIGCRHCDGSFKMDYCAMMLDATIIRINKETDNG